jgi:hypothetical protein
MILFGLYVLDTNSSYPNWLSSLVIQFTDRKHKQKKNQKKKKKPENTPFLTTISWL